MHLQMDENTAINLISLNANGREAFCEDEKASIIFDWWVRDGLVSWGRVDTTFDKRVR